MFQSQIMEEDFEQVIGKGADVGKENIELLAEHPCTRASGSWNYSRRTLEEEIRGGEMWDEQGEVLSLHWKV